MSWVLSGFADEAGGEIDTQIKATKDAGYSHIDLRGVDGFNITELPLDHAEAIAKKLADAGIKVGMYGTPLGKIDIADDFQIDSDKLAHIGKLKDIFGCDQVRIFSYYNKGEVAKDKWQAESLDRLKKLRDQAGQLGLVLFHENERHIFGDRCDEVEVLAAELRDGGAFKLIFDFDNYNQSGDDVWNNWQRLGDKTDAFHLKDSDTNNQHVPIGQGNGRAKEILADALKRGWSGPVSLEPHLRHSAAVMATHASGSENQKFSDMTAEEVYQVAAATATQLLSDIGAPVV